MPNDAPIENQCYADALTQEDHRRFAECELERAAGRCPDCLYDVSGLLHENKWITCPECGAPLNKQANTEIWKRRRRRARLYRFLTFGSGACGLVCIAICYFLSPIAVMVLMGGHDLFINILLLLCWIALVAAPIAAFYGCYQLRSQYEPTSSFVGRIMLSGLAAFGNLIPVSPFAFFVL